VSAQLDSVAAADRTSSLFRFCRSVSLFLRPVARQHARGGARAKPLQALRCSCLPCLSHTGSAHAGLWQHPAGCVESAAVRIPPWLTVVCVCTPVCSCRALSPSHPRRASRSPSRPRHCRAQQQPLLPARRRRPPSQRRPARRHEPGLSLRRARARTCAQSRCAGRQCCSCVVYLLRVVARDARVLTSHRVCWQSVPPA
jgi:hypothetical protein